MKAIGVHEAFRVSEDLLDQVDPQDLEDWMEHLERMVLLDLKVQRELQDTKGHLD